MAGFVIHISAGPVASYLDGGPDPEVYLQPRCAKHLRSAQESDARLHEEGPSDLLVGIGFVGSATGSIEIVRPRPPVV